MPAVRRVWSTNPSNSNGLKHCIALAQIIHLKKRIFVMLGNWQRAPPGNISIQHPSWFAWICTWCLEYLGSLLSKSFWFVYWAVTWQRATWICQCMSKSYLKMEMVWKSRETCKQPACKLGWMQDKYSLLYNCPISKSESMLNNGCLQDASRLLLFSGGINSHNHKFWWHNYSCLDFLC